MIDIAYDRTLINRLAMRIGRASDVVATSLRDVSLSMKKVAQGFTPVDTGKAKKSWRTLPVEIRNRTQFETGVENTATSSRGFPYPAVLDSGSGVGSKPWPRPGPRTIRAASPAGGSRIYSRQAPGGISNRVLETIRPEDIVNKLLNALNG